MSQHTIYSVSALYNTLGIKLQPNKFALKLVTFENFVQIEMNYHCSQFWHYQMPPKWDSTVEKCYTTSFDFAYLFNLFRNGQGSLFHFGVIGKGATQFAQIFDHGFGSFRLSRTTFTTNLFK